MVSRLAIIKAGAPECGPLRTAAEPHGVFPCEPAVLLRAQQVLNPIKPHFLAPRAVARRAKNLNQGVENQAVCTRSASGVIAGNAAKYWQAPPGLLPCSAGQAELLHQRHQSGARAD